MPQPARKKPSENKRKRSPGFTRISVTLPNNLIAVMDHAAAADNRSRSNFIEHFLHLLKQANPFLGEPRPPRDKSPAQNVTRPPGHCPRGHNRPCDRNRRPVPIPSPN